MLRDIIFCRNETEYLVAAFAATTVLSVSKLPEMDIPVAVRAICKLQTGSHIPGNMTFVTGDLPVQPQQREAGQRVIEIVAFDAAPAE